MTTKFARIISIVFHPVFLLFYVTMISVFTPSFSTHFETTFQKYIFCGFILLFVTVCPCLLMLLLKHFRIINSFDMETTRERWIPFIFNCLIYAFVFFVLDKYFETSFLKTFFLGILILQIVIFIVNFFWKISIHAAGIGAITGSFIALSWIISPTIWWYSAGSIILSVIIMLARFKLKAHSNLQIALGWQLGFVVMYFLIYYGV